MSKSRNKMRRMSLKEDPERGHVGLIDELLVIRPVSAWKHIHSQARDLSQRTITSASAVRSANTLTFGHRG
jgi:hypothetical protein